MTAKAVVAYTKHGLRRHYGMAATGTGLMVEGGVPGLTLCWRPVVPLASRSRLFRRRLVQASFCGRCEEAEEELGE